MGYAHVGNYDYRSILILRQDRVLLGPGSVPLRVSSCPPSGAAQEGRDVAEYDWHGHACAEAYRTLSPVAVPRALFKEEEERCFPASNREKGQHFEPR